MQIFKSELQSILNHFSEGNKNMNEQVFGQKWILLYFRISRHVNFLRFKFLATGHTFYQKKIMVSRILSLYGFPKPP